MKTIGLKIGTIVALFFIVLGSSTVGAQEEVKFLLSPVKAVEQSTGFYRDTVSGGETKNYDFYLQNLKDEPLEVWVYPADAKPGANGGKLFSGREEKLTAVGSWIEPSGPHKVSLGAREKQKLSFKVKVPEDIVPGQHVGVVAVEEFLDETDRQTPEVNSTNAIMLIEKAQRMGVQIVLEHQVEQAKHEMSIDDFKHEYIANGYSQFTVKLSNKGTILERPNGLLQVRDAEGNGIFSESYNNQPKERSIYAGTTADMIYVVQDKVLLPGEYSAYFEANFSGEKVSKTFNFTVTEAEAQKSQDALNHAGILQKASFWDWIQNNLILAIVIGIIFLVFVIGFFLLLFLLLKKKKKEQDDEQSKSKLTSHQFSVSRSRH
ncbi:hypothetical protein BK126_26395 [Paenibacillus sp. FSL H7-0326]|uniref:COG1470 family protein n=1 Tax=Paenibacillus sp. FSL H7-0326 TaxID=1921144 RepID=UPI00096CB9F3|nr:DUF916 domain-containing protein [Paenibacillus sp. FSL H7-0326]OMC63726.1 hypothetical protein BK126_26395 [Paenibacillus sp. FSL H7-0326]